MVYWAPHSDPKGCNGYISGEKIGREKYNNLVVEKFVKRVWEISRYMFVFAITVITYILVSISRDSQETLVFWEILIRLLRK